MDKNEFKDQGFELIASIAKVIGNAHRLELLELLANGSKNVEELARESRLGISNASQHLQRLKQFKLVNTRREATSIYYMLADDSILSLIEALHQTAHKRLPELENTIADFRKQFGTDQAVLKGEPKEDCILLDVRPTEEFKHGHMQGAINIPHYNIAKSTHGLDKSKLIVAYCRGELCALADEVVRQLREAGFNAVRLEDTVIMKSA